MSLLSEHVRNFLHVPPHIVKQDRIKPFPTEAAFEEWLAAHHATEKEVWIQIYKKGSGVQTITPVQAIDVALCWGWIDGVRKGLDETSFLQRYTPRGAKSAWSQINRDSVARLTAAGRMKPQGQRQVDRAKADGRLDAVDPPLRSAIEPLPADQRVANAANPRSLDNLLGRPDVLEPASRTNGAKTAAGRAKKNAELDAPPSPGEAIVAERAAPERTPPKRAAAAAKATAKPAKKKAAPPKRAAAPAKAKAKPTKKKAAASKRAAAPAKAKAKPAKKKAAAPKRAAAPARVTAKPAKKKAAASKRPAKAKAKKPKAR